MRDPNYIDRTDLSTCFLRVPRLLKVKTYSSKVKVMQNGKLVNDTYWVMRHFDEEYLLCTEHQSIFPEKRYNKWCTIISLVSTTYFLMLNLEKSTQ